MNVLLEVVSSHSPIDNAMPFSSPIWGSVTRIGMTEAASHHTSLPQVIASTDCKGENNRGESRGLSSPVSASTVT